MPLPQKVSDTFRRLNPHMYGGAPIPSNSTAPSKPMIRQQQGDGMNKTERAFLAWLKEEIPNVRIHREISLPLANGCRYKVDFVTASPSIEGVGYFLQGWEVKGFMRDDAAVKLKVAASAYPWISFNLVSRKSQKSAWEIQRVQA